MPFAKRLTGGRGADEVAEVGGPGTLEKSIAASRMAGPITPIGVLTGFAGDVPTAAIMFKNIRLSCAMVGAREQQPAMIEGVESTGIRPVIDRSFTLSQIADAFRYQKSQRHYGKICLTLC